MNNKNSYKLITQKQYCCVPACITMILNRRKIKHGSQEEIGYYLGLVRTGKKPSAGYGTQVNKKEYSINNFFKKNKISLKEKYYPINKPINVKKFITENLNKHNDLIVCFNNKKLYGQGNYGHVSLIQEVNNEIVTLIDPEKDVSKKRKVKLSRLIGAINYHGVKKRGGLWLISK